MSRSSKRIRSNRHPGRKYRSKLEFQLFEDGPLRGVPYEEGEHPYDYHVHAKYTPDGHFTYKGQEVWVEVKGRFDDKAEADKYIHIRECYPDVEILFVFQERGTKMPRCKNRTQERWAEMNGFSYTFSGELLSYLKSHYPNMRL